MAKRIRFQQLMLADLAGCNNGDIVHKIDGKGEAASINRNSDFSSRAQNPGWDNVAMGISSSNTTSTNNRSLFGRVDNGSTYRNANMDMQATNSNSAAYITQTSQTFHSISDNPNLQPTSSGAALFGEGPT